MTRYSVYNPTRQQYEVYVDLAGPAYAPRPKTGPVVSVQDALTVLPRTASLVGFSDTPVGIVSQQRKLEVGLFTLAVIGGLVYILLTMQPGDL